MGLVGLAHEVQRIRIDELRGVAEVLLSLRRTIAGLEAATKSGGSRNRVSIAIPGKAVTRELAGRNGNHGKKRAKLYLGVIVWAGTWSGAAWVVGRITPEKCA